MKHLPSQGVRKPRGFSLIELIAVMTISIVLLAVGVGIFRNQGAEAVQTAAEKMNALIEQARTAAITRRAPVALVIMRPGEAGYTDGVCRIGIFELEEWEDGVDLTGRQLQRWTTLPSGVVFFGGPLDGLDNVVDQSVIRLTWKDGDESGVFEGLVFSPRGGLLAPAGSESVVVSMGGGTYKGSTAVETRGGGRRGIRVGRVVARAWNLDV